MPKQSAADKTADQSAAQASGAAPNEPAPGATASASDHAQPDVQTSTESGGEQESLPGVESVAVGVDSLAPFGRDAEGNPLAPHGVRSDGTPAAKRGPKTPESTLNERATQRAKLKSVTPSTARPRPGAGATVTALAVVNYQAMGNAVADLFFNGGRMLLGEGWAPDEKAGEPEAVAGAFRDYFKSTNARDLPPSLGLIFVLSVYTLKHAQVPSVQTRLQAFGAWIKDKMPKRGIRFGS